MDWCMWKLPVMIVSGHLRAPLEDEIKTGQRTYLENTALNSKLPCWFAIKLSQYQSAFAAVEVGFRK